MKWRDSEENTSASEPAVDKSFASDPNAEWNEAAELNAAKRNAAAASPRSSSVWVVVAVAVLGLIIILILPRVQPSGGEEQLLALETRIEALELQLTKFDSVDENVSRIWEQAKSFEQFKERFERSDASTSLRMDHLATSLSAVQKRVEKLEKVGAKAAAPAPKTTTSKPKTPAAATVKPSSPKATAGVRYHTIAKGDTLYSVGRKYGLKVDQLLKINQLPKDTVIKPGQRLRVTP